MFRGVGDGGRGDDLPTPALAPVTWLGVQFLSMGRRKIHLILFQVFLQISRSDAKCVLHLMGPSAL